MKAEIHPEYVEASVHCSCGSTFTTRSTKDKLNVELCSECHPFYTGKQKLVDTGGRIERFERRHGKRTPPPASAAPTPPATAASAPEPAPAVDAAADDATTEDSSAEVAPAPPE